MFLWAFVGIITLMTPPMIMAKSSVKPIHIGIGLFSSSLATSTPKQVAQHYSAYGAVQRFFIASAISCGKSPSVAIFTVA